MRLHLLRKYLVIVLVVSPSLIRAQASFFIENKGQIQVQDSTISNEIIAVYQNKMYSIYFQKNKISYVFKKTIQKPVDIDLTNFQEKKTFQVLTYRVDLDFIGAKNEFNFTLSNSKKHIVIENGFQ
jgi:hypothetical protein